MDASRTKSGRSPEFCSLKSSGNDLFHQTQTDDKLSRLCLLYHVQSNSAFILLTGNCIFASQKHISPVHLNYQPELKTLAIVDLV